MVVFSDIARGLFNTLFKSKCVEIIANRRLMICNNCEFSGKKKARCKLCGCFLKLKSRCISETNSCPIGNWFKINDIIDIVHAKKNIHNAIELMAVKIGIRNSLKIYRYAEIRLSHNANETSSGYTQEIQEQILLYKKDGACLTESEAAKMASILVNNIMMDKTLS